MPSAVCWSKMVLRLSVSFSLALVMWRSNLSSGTSFLCLDAMIALRWFIIKNFAELYCAWLCFTLLCWYITLLHFTSLDLDVLHCAVLRWSALYFVGILLCFTSLRSAGLNWANLYVGMLHSALLGYNFAMLHCSTLHCSTMCYAELRCVRI